MDDVSGTNHGTGTAGQALVGENEGAVFRDLDGSGGACFFTQTAADTGDFAHVEAAGILIGAEDYDGVSFHTEVDHALGTCQIAGTATDALVLVHFRHSVGVEGNGTETANINASTATGTAIVTQIGAVLLLLCTATAVTVDAGDLLRKFFLNEHRFQASFLSAFVGRAG